MTSAADERAPIEVLLVEDDPGDVLMTREAFEEHKVRNHLNVVSDGADALAYVRREGAFANAVRPDLILLDLNLPKRDGREVLREMKTDPDLREIPIVVLTTSSAESDVQASYQLYANAYVTKPVDFERFISAVKQIDDFFISLVKLPRRAV
jgi:CheY-like chemotaxis protein